MYIVKSEMGYDINCFFTFIDISIMNIANIQIYHNAVIYMYESCKCSLPLVTLGMHLTDNIIITSAQITIIILVLVVVIMSHNKRTNSSNDDNDDFDGRTTDRATMMKFPILA